MAKKDAENWVVYKDLKERISLAMVLARYGILEKLKPSGASLTGCCPIHKGSNPRQFSVNLERSLFNCFGNCKAGGNVLDFVAKMEDVSIREAALLLQEWFPASAGPSSAPPRNQVAPDHHQADKTEKEAVKPAIATHSRPDPSEQADESEQAVINPPLKFVLKNLDPQHGFFQERGIQPETVTHFGLGYCSRGLLKGRIAIPIHNEKGDLVAYCGRAVTAQQAREEGKYKLPGSFAKSAVVYNLNRQAPDVSTLILVESYLSVHWLWQAGIKNAVALMGSSLSEAQEELIAGFLGPEGRVYLLFDADEDGGACSADCLARLGKRLWVKALDISPYGRKPHRLTRDQLMTLVPLVLP